MKNTKNRGFTLLELMLTLAVVGVVIGIGIPSFQEMIKNSRIVSNTNALIGVFNFARFEAIKRGNTVTLGQRNTTTWAGGVVVSSATGDELRVSEPLPTANTVVSSNSRSSFVFQASGEVNNDDVLTICDDRTGETGRQITLLTSGIIISEEVTCG